MLDKFCLGCCLALASTVDLVAGNNNEIRTGAGYSRADFDKLEKREIHYTFIEVIATNADT